MSAGGFLPPSGAPPGAADAPGGARSSGEAPPQAGATSLRRRLAHALHAFPTLFRVGLAEVVAYRAEFIVWILTTNLPLVNLALWHAVSAGGPIGRLGQKEFTAYFVAVLVVRLLTGSWVVWQLTMDIRQGTVAVRLLRPIHPLFTYMAEHLAAIPLRLAVVSPLLLLLWVKVGPGFALRDLHLFPIFVASLAGGWLITFSVMILIGTLAFYIESAAALFDLWLGVHAVLSGYIIPLELFPAWVGSLSRALPFWYTIGFPVEVLAGLGDWRAELVHLGVQWLWVGALGAAALALWRQGVRRVVAYGG